MALTLIFFYVWYVLTNRWYESLDEWERNLEAKCGKLEGDKIGPDQALVSIGLSLCGFGVTYGVIL